VILRYVLHIKLRLNKQGNNMLQKKQTVLECLRSSRLLKVLAFTSGILIGASSAVAAVPAIYLDQSSIYGVSDTLKVSRLPVLNAGGTIRYYDVLFKLQVDAVGAPALAPLNPVVSLSPALTGGGFVSGNYKDSEGNVFLLSGPGVLSGGRTSWSLLLTKPSASCGAACQLQANWFTGPIAGHPLQARLTLQNITSTTANYSWGTVNGSKASLLSVCNGSSGVASDIVGFVQSGNQLGLHGFCAGNNLETHLLTLNLCTTANPCP
jgi:hypothetical protein